MDLRQKVTWSLSQRCTLHYREHFTQCTRRAYGTYLGNSQRCHSPLRADLVEFKILEDLSRLLFQIDASRSARRNQAGMHLIWSRSSPLRYEAERTNRSEEVEAPKPLQTHSKCRLASFKVNIAESWRAGTVWSLRTEEVIFQQSHRAGPAALVWNHWKRWVGAGEFIAPRSAWAQVVHDISQLLKWRLKKLQFCFFQSSWDSRRDFA